MLTKWTAVHSNRPLILLFSFMLMLFITCAYAQFTQAANNTDSHPHFSLFQSSVEKDSTTSVAIGDLDNDGDLDYIVGNASLDATGSPNRIYLNDGEGSFTLHQSTTEADDTYSVTLGDLDNDGDLDCVAGNIWAPNRIYLNDGEGNFTLHQSTTEADDTYSVTLGDLDNDGDLDYIAGNYLGSNRIYRNDGKASFTLYESSTETDRTNAVALGDLDNDGDLDYIAGNYWDANKTYLNDGNGNFTLYYTSDEVEYTVSVALGDLDNDGDLDYIAGNSLGQPNKIYLNDGTGNFTLCQSSQETDRTLSIALGDLDNDGDLDYIAGNSLGQPNKIYLNDGTGNFTLYSTTSEIDETYEIALADLDKDKDLDFIVGDFSSQANKVYKNNMAEIKSNTPPEPPKSNFSSAYKNGKLTLSWGYSQDFETPITGLYYCVRIGTSAGKSDIKSGIYAVSLRTLRQTNTITMTLPLDDYFWAVQTIDTGLKTSAWSNEQVFYGRTPIADAGGPYKVNEGKELTFDGSASYDIEGDPLTYNWDFGDRINGQGVHPVHTYAIDGTYRTHTITLVVEDDKANSSAPAYAQVDIHVRGDINLDGKVDVFDLVLVAKAFGLTSQDPSWDQYRKTDINSDNQVNIFDLVLVAKDFNKTKQ